MALTYLASKADIKVNVPTLVSSTILGYQERIETGIDWTVIETAARHHKLLCQNEDIPQKTFSEALQNKIDNGILGHFLNEDSGLTLQQQWEFLYPTTFWDNEKFATDEGKICFQNANCITDEMETIIKEAVKYNSRDVLKKRLKSVHLLRVNNAQVPLHPFTKPFIV